MKGLAVFCRKLGSVLAKVSIKLVLGDHLAEIRVTLAQWIRQPQSEAVFTWRNIFASEIAQ